MTRTALLLSLAIAAAIVCPSPAAAQDVIAVGPDSPDGEPCEPKGPQEVPCSPQAAIKLAVPGTRLELRGGVYKCLAIAGLHGTPDYPIVFAPALGAAVTFSCADTTAAATISIRDSSNLTFRGFAIASAAGRPFATVTNSPAVSFEACTWGDASAWSVSPPR